MKHIISSVLLTISFFCGGFSVAGFEGLFSRYWWIIVSAAIISAVFFILGIKIYPERFKKGTH